MKHDMAFDNSSINVFERMLFKLPKKKETDDFYITNEKGVDLHNVHGILYITGMNDEHAKATFFRNTWSVGNTIQVSHKNEPMFYILKVSMEIKANEGRCRRTFEFPNYLE